MIQSARQAQEIDADALMERLVAQGHRATRPRRAVLAALAERGSATAQELVEAVRAGGAGIGRATVFRTLDLLATLGAVERLHRPGGCHAYVLARPGHRHHLVCSDCGAVVEFSECALDEALAALGRRTAFRISGHWLEVVGVCGACQRPPDAAASLSPRPA
jgi:Fur family ferric uptake transcriptional regulator